MRTLTLLALLLAPPAFAQNYLVWPDSDPEVVAETRDAAAKLVAIDDGEAAVAALAQTRELGANCVFGDTECLQGVMNLIAVPRLLWVVAEGAGLKGVAVVDGIVRVAAVADRDPVALVTQLLAPAQYKGTLILEGIPGGAKIRVDGKVADVMSEHAPGRHAVRVEAAGFVPFEADAEIKLGEETRLPVVLEPVKEIGPGPDPDPPPRRGLSATGYAGSALLGVGASTAAGVGAWIGLVFLLDSPADPNGNLMANGQAGLIAIAAAGTVATVGATLLGLDLIGD